MNILSSYSWPGNIRELRNFCENLVVLHRGGEITPYDLDPRFFGHTSEFKSSQLTNELPFQLKKMKKDFCVMLCYRQEEIEQKLLNLWG